MQGTQDLEFNEHRTIQNMHDTLVRRLKQNKQYRVVITTLGGVTFKFKINYYVRNNNYFCIPQLSKKSCLIHKYFFIY